MKSTVGSWLHRIRAAFPIVAFGAIACSVVAFGAIACGGEGTGPWGVTTGLRIESGIADTLYQRSVSVVLSPGAAGSANITGAWIDPGLPSERQAAVLYPCTRTYYWSASTVCAGDPTHLVELTHGSGLSFWVDTLANGPHRLVVTYSVAGQVDSLVAGFVTHVAGVPYSLTALPGIGGTDSDALDVNAVGAVAGWANDATGAMHAVTWRSGAVTTLPTSATARSSRAVALNDAGEAVGGVVDTAGTGYCEQAVRWTSVGWQYVVVQGGTAVCGQRARDINTGDAMLVTWPQDGGRLDIVSWLVQGTAQTQLKSIFPSAINDRGEVVGSSWDLANVAHFYSPNVPVIAPGTRPPINYGHPFGELLSINEQSQVLGWYAGTTFLSMVPGTRSLDLNPFLAQATPVRVADGGIVLAFDASVNTAYLWRAGRTFRVELTTPGWRLDRVAGINASGVIVGHATETATGRMSAVVLTPAP